MSSDMGTRRYYSDSAWRYSDAYLYARGDTGDGEERCAGGTPRGGRADYPGQYLPPDAASRLRADRVVWRPARCHALGWRDSDRERRLRGLGPGPSAQVERRGRDIQTT